MPITTPRFVRASEAVDAPVPPSATVISVMPVTEPLVIVVLPRLAVVAVNDVIPLRVPPVMATALAACVAMLPSPNVARCAVVSASSSNARPAAVHAISSTSPAPAVERPSNVSVALTS